MDEHEHYITDQDIDRAAAEPTGAQAGRIEALARAANRSASMKGSAIPMTTGRVLVDDVRPYAVDVTGLTEYRVTFGQQYRHTPNTRLAEAHPDGWLAIFAVDETTARDAAWDRLDTEWSDIDVASGEDIKHMPRGELARWVITEHTRTGC